MPFSCEIITFYIIEPDVSELLENKKKVEHFLSQVFFFVLP